VHVFNKISSFILARLHRLRRDQDKENDRPEHPGGRPLHSQAPDERQPGEHFHPGVRHWDCREAGQVRGMWQVFLVSFWRTCLNRFDTRGWLDGPRRASGCAGWERTLAFGGDHELGVQAVREWRRVHADQHFCRLHTECDQDELAGSVRKCQHNYI